MHTLPSKGTGHNLHRPLRIITPPANGDFAHATVACREQRSMPAEYPFGGERCAVILRGVQHHFDHAFDVAISRRQSADVHTKTSGDRGPYLISVQNLAFNFGRL